MKGLSFRKQVNLGNGTYLNLSKKGASLSQKVGPVTINSRGTTTIRLAPGITYRVPKATKNK